MQIIEDLIEKYRSYIIEYGQAKINVERDNLLRPDETTYNLRIRLLNDFTNEGQGHLRFLEDALQKYKNANLVPSYSSLVYHVYIAYERSQIVVAELIEAYLKKCGCTVALRDPSVFRSLGEKSLIGFNDDQRAKREIEASDLFIYLLSVNDAGFSKCLQDYHYAGKQNKPILALNTGVNDIPDYLKGNIQVDFVDWSKGLVSLIEYLTHLDEHRTDEISQPTKWLDTLGEQNLKAVREAIRFIRQDFMYQSDLSPHSKAEIDEATYQIERCWDSSGEILPNSRDTLERHINTLNVQICIPVYSIPFRDFVRTFQDSDALQISQGDEKDKTLTRVQYQYERIQIIRQIRFHQEKIQASATSSIGTGISVNDYLISSKIKELEHLDASAKSSYFDVIRSIRLEDQYIELEDGRVIDILSTDRPVELQIRILNLGDVEQEINCIETIDGPVEIFECEAGLHNEKQRISGTYTIAPKTRVQFSYKIFFRTIGQAVFKTELNYHQSGEDWDKTSTNILKCKAIAGDPVVLLERYYAYREGYTEILLRITNQEECGLATEFEVLEKYMVGNRSYEVKPSIDIPYLLPGDTTTVSYQIEGEPKAEILSFSDESYISYSSKNNVDRRFKGTFQEEKFRLQLLEYPGLSNRQVLVARQEAVNTINKILGRDHKGFFQFILIKGSRGIGKSKLLDIIRLKAKESGFHVVYEKFERSTNPILKLVAGVLDVSIDHVQPRLEAITELILEHPDAVHSLIEYITRSRSITFEETEINIDRLYQALVVLISHVCKTTPIAVVFDDLHELQYLSYIDILSKIISYFHNAGIVSELGDRSIVFAFAQTKLDDSDKYLTQLADEFENRVKRLTGVKVFDLKPLSENESYELIDQIIEYPYFDNSLKYWVYKWSDGIPQVLYDILVWLTGSHQLRVNGNYWTKPDWVDSDDIHFPNLTEVLTEFASSHLGEQEFDLLRMLSVVGEQIPFSLVQELYKRNYSDSDSLRTYLQRLWNVGFIILPSSEDWLDTSIVFSHISRRNAIYDSDQFDISVKKEYRKQIFEIIRDNLYIYPDANEHIRQCAHHLTKCIEDVIYSNLEILYLAAEVELANGNFRLGQHYMQYLLSQENQVDERFWNLYYIYIDRFTSFTGDLEEAENEVDKSRVLLKQASSKNLLNQNKVTFYEAMLNRSQASILYRKGDPESIKLADQLIRNVVEKLEALKPRNLLFFSQPRLEDYPYRELLNSYILCSQILHKALQIDPPQGIGTYGRIQYVSEYSNKAISLANWILQQSPNNISLTVQVKISLANLYAAFAHSESHRKARAIFEDAIKTAQKQNLHYYEGIAQMQLAQLHLQEVDLALFSSPSPIKEFDTISEEVIWLSIPRIIYGDNRGWLKGLDKQIFHSVLECYQHAIQANQIVKNISGLGEAHLATGILYHFGKLDDDAIRHYELAAECYSQIGSIFQRWITYLGALHLYMKRKNYLRSSQLWDQVFPIYSQFYDDRYNELDNTSLPHTEIFGWIANKIESYFIQNEDVRRQLEAITVQVNEIFTQLPDDQLFELYLREGMLRYRTGQLIYARDAFHDSLELAETQDNADLIIRAAQELVVLYANPSWQPDHAPDFTVLGWRKDQPEHYLYLICMMQTRKLRMEEFFTAYDDLIENVKQKTGTWHQFSLAYVKIMQQLFNRSDITKYIDKFIDKTVRALVKVPTDAAELLTYTGKQFLRRDVIRRVSPQTAKQLGLRCFIQAEGVYLNENKENEGYVYALSDLIYGYLAFNEADKFGSSVAAFVDLSLQSDDLTVCNAILRIISMRGISHKIPLQYLKQVADQIDKIDNNQLSNRIQYIESTTKRPYSAEPERQFLQYKVDIFTALADKLVESDQKNAQKYGAIALKQCVQLLNSGTEADNSWVYNRVSVNLHHVFEQKRTVANNLVLCEEVVRAHHKREGKGIDLANALINWAQARLSVGQHENFKEIMYTAYWEAIKECLMWDAAIQGKFEEEAKLSKHNPLAQSIRARNSLLAILRLSRMTFSDISHIDRLIDRLQNQMEEPLLIIDQPIEQIPEFFNIVPNISLNLELFLMGGYKGQLNMSMPSIVSILNEIRQLDVENLPELKPDTPSKIKPKADSEPMPPREPSSKRRYKIQRELPKKPVDTRNKQLSILRKKEKRGGRRI